MPEHLHYEDDAIVNPDTQHEESDVNVRALAIFGIVFVAFSIFTHFLIWYMYKGFVHMERRSSAANPVLTSMARPADAGIPASPRLQPFPSRAQGGDVVAPYSNTPVTDMTEMRRSQDEQLATYGWIDQARGSVHVPIATAKQIALQRGFGAPVNPAAAAAAPAQTATAPAAQPASAPAVAVAPAMPAPQPAATAGSHP
jgi:hypothetical protein